MFWKMSRALNVAKQKVFQEKLKLCSKTFLLIEDLEEISNQWLSI